MLLNVSIAVAKDIYAVLLIGGSTIVTRKVGRFSKAESEGTPKEKHLIACKTAITLAKSFLEDNNEYDELVVRTASNNVVNFANQGYASEQYQDLFLDMFKILDSIPVSYQFVHDTAPVAKQYTKEKYIESVALEGVSFFDGIDDDI